MVGCAAYHKYIGLSKALYFIPIDTKCKILKHSAQLMVVKAKMDMKTDGKFAANRYEGE